MTRTCITCGKKHPTDAERGLCYITHGPEHAFHRETIATARRAMRLIRQLRNTAKVAKRRQAFRGAIACR